MVMRGSSLYMTPFLFNKLESLISEWKFHSDLDQAVNGFDFLFNMTLVKILKISLKLAKFYLNISYKLAF